MPLHQGNSQPSTLSPRLPRHGRHCGQLSAFIPGRISQPIHPAEAERIKQKENIKNMNTISVTLSIFSVVLTIASAIGGFYAFKNGLSRTANEVQERVINALHEEI